MYTTSHDQSSIEQIILSSVLKSNIAARLAEVPPDDKPELLAILGRAIRVMFDEESFKSEWLIVAITGYAGKKEHSNRLRTIWKREFPTPLPPTTKVRDAYGCTEVFKLSIGSMNYNFNKADGVYIGRTSTPSTAQSL